MAMKQWQIQRRVVPSLQMYENARSKFRSGAQNDTFSIVWSRIRSCKKQKKMIRVKFYPNVISNLRITQYGSIKIYLNK